MKDERYKQIMTDLGMPNSISLLAALQQVASEVAQDVMKSQTDTALLRELINRNDYHVAPVKTAREGLWHSSVIGIGADNIADICLTDEALQALFSPTK